MLIPVALTVTETLLFCIIFAFTITLSAYTHIATNDNLLMYSIRQCKNIWGKNFMLKKIIFLSVKNSTSVTCSNT